MSTGKPVKTPADMNRVKNEYLETLKLQSKLNNIILQAVKTYKSSGQLPPSTQMSDTRTTTEIMADTEKLKQGIVSDFASVLESQNALNFVNKLMASNLNVDNKLLRFVAQSAPEIVGQLKKRYKYGIAGDENDIDTIIQFINKMFNDRSNVFKSVKSYMNTSSLQGSTGNIISANDTSSMIANLEDIMSQLNNLYRGSPGYDFMKRLIADIIPTIFFIRDKLPTSFQLKNTISEIGNNDVAFYESKAGENAAAVFDLLDKLPKVETLNTFISLMKDAIKRKAKPEKVAEIMTRFNNEFGELTNPIIQNQISDFFDEWEGAVQKAEPVPPVGINKGEQFLPMQATPLDYPTTGSEMLFNPPEPTEQEVNAQRKERTNQAVEQIVGAREMYQYIMGLLEPLTEWKFKDVLSKLKEKYIDFFNPDSKEYSYVDFTFFNLPLDEQKDIVASFLSEKFTEGAYVKSSLGVKNVEGLGIKQKRRVGRPRGSGIAQVQVIRPPTFVGFGINEINQKNLDKNILTIRRNTRTSYNDMPSKHISEKMKSIVKTIVGGGVPNFNDLASLDEEEKNYLYKLVNRSNLESRLSVPAPSKDQREKEIHQFEVMRGEIMSGNDSKDLVKKFKLLVVKLMNQGLLPKSEATDVLENLVMLGY